MSSPDPLRLRVSIQRNGVPEVKLVWPCARSHDLTVSKLVAQINDVVPLEGGEWGLEDYVVELSDGKGGSYECLHFQQVAQILKDEDQVLVRCLQGEDLRRRRLNGRHQISADGKHLVDGLAFGRPWLRTPRDRPALELPPRKRPRASREYEYNDTDREVERDEAQEQLLLEGPEPGNDGEYSLTDDDAHATVEADTAAFEDEYCVDSEEADSEDSDDAGTDEEEMGDGVADIDEEVRLLLADNRAIGHDPLADDAETASLGGPGQDAVSNTNLNLGSQDCIAALQAAFPLMPTATVEAEYLRQRKDLHEAYRALQMYGDPALSYDETLDKTLMGLLGIGESFISGGAGGDTLQQANGPARPLIQVVESADGPSDAESASESSDEGSGPSHRRAQSSPPTDGYSNDESSDSDDTSSSGWSGGDGSSHQSERDERSDGDSGDDSSDDSSSDDSDADSDSDSSDSSDSDENGAPVGNPSTQNAHRHGGQGNARGSNKGFGSAMGLTQTQKRNARRRRLNALHRQVLREHAEPRNEDSADALLERKERLLRAISQGSNTEENGQNDQGARVDGAAEEAQEKIGSKASEQRRSRVDMGAGRRLLFGALGLRTPKTKADEDKIKQGLMKDVRPLHNARLTEGEGAGEERSAMDTDPEEWRQRVTYRAVECCQEGVVLSEPPFPFEQRWDPQQQYKSKGKRKRNSQEFYEEYYDDSGVYEDGDHGQAKRRQSGGVNPFGRMVTDGTEDAAASNTAVPDSDGGSAQATLPPAASRVEVAEILPALPADVTSLAKLEAGAAKEGMVITWKQMEMSKATRWQPEMAQKTGLVLAGSDEAKLRVLLAVRDRENRDKTYDERTGERVYDKFEVPDSDGEEGEDDGQRVVAWGEMMEPRVLRAAGADAAGQDEQQAEGGDDGE
ncbi:Uncharacterized protein TPAR_07985 [Tolypocladium paradoxum]|uniref:DUF7357 domain-containing protein n=1 Tax=Tolypocladium paradoxum TaxID=94208 RepID=A0A2S4KNN8_9HYPO|nr:Uncharacterized protein TPAR_07985 [Tolypocladium paradoxum]